MTTAVFQYAHHVWASMDRNAAIAGTAQLVLFFASKAILAEPGVYDAVRKKFPLAAIALCSTAGEICQHEVLDNAGVAAALHFDNTTIATAQVNIKDFPDSYTAGSSLVSRLPPNDLSYILILSDGAAVNGSELVKGINSITRQRVLCTGGLAGDGTDFNTTLVGLNGQPREGTIVAIGLYGNNIVVTHGTGGGWRTFGLEKEVTSSSGNKLFELDGSNALGIYKRYLGPDAAALPGSALLFPLSVKIPGIPEPVVRTILSIDDHESSMTFAGDIPQGSAVRFMRSNFDMLTEAAAEAAKNANERTAHPAAFSLLISCVGRKIILGQRTEEEVDAVIGTLAPQTPLAGFYSYGEIAPFQNGGDSHLHNQTMTITSFYEHPQTA